MPPKNLSPKKFRKLTQLFMASAQAHHHSSERCSINPGIKGASVGDAYLHIVAIELTLLSIEQCLRLLCLLHTKKTPPKARHDVWSLYNTVLRKCGDSENMQNQVVVVMNEFRKTESTYSFTVEEIRTFLKKHRYAYSDTRYFSVNKDGEIKPGFRISFRAKEILTYLSLALIAIGIVEMGRQNIEMANPLDLDIFS